MSWKPLVVGLAAVPLVLLWLLSGVNVAVHAQGWFCRWIPFLPPVHCPEQRQTAHPAEKGPRQILKDVMGITWSEQNFWEAMSRGDERAVALFLSGGMTVRSEPLHRLLSDKLEVRRAPLKRLVEHKGKLNGEFCSSDDTNGTSAQEKVPDHRSVLRFASYVGEPLAHRFVSDFCGGADLAAALRQRLGAERARLEHLRSINDSNQKGHSACVATLHDKAFYRILAGLNIQLAQGKALIECKGNGYTDLLKRDFCAHLAAAVERHEREKPDRTASEYEARPGDWVPAFCAKRFPHEKETDTSAYDSLASAVTAYGG